ncbi:hypothetical protein F4778DRAFT_779994 [Xylariomycetidae sp. FL2044]|nr:hypothetical protein F4778DRAFT_779994 [Xylariomycetidae sp. FL2044]
MKVIWHETNMIICVTNNILSIKKEIKQVDSLVPLSYLDAGSVQGAVDQAFDILKTSVRRLDEGENEILERYKKSPDQLKSDIRAYIDSCKHAFTASLNFT